VDAGGVSAASSRADETLLADGEVVWSWRLDAGVKFRGGIREMTETKKPELRGEHEISRKPLRGECRVIPV